MNPPRRPADEHERDAADERIGRRGGRRRTLGCSRKCTVWRAPAAADQKPPHRRRGVGGRQPDRRVQRDQARRLRPAPRHHATDEAGKREHAEDADEHSRRGAPPNGVNPHALPGLAARANGTSSCIVRAGLVSVIAATDLQRPTPANDFQLPSSSATRPVPSCPALCADPALRKLVGRWRALVVSTHKGRQSEAAGTRKERQGCRSACGRERVTLSPHEMNRLAVHAATAGCRRVVSCPILDTAGLALRPPYGGFPTP